MSDMILERAATDMRTAEDHRLSFRGQISLVHAVTNAKRNFPRLHGPTLRALSMKSDFMSSINVQAASLLATWALPSLHFH